MTKFIQFVVSSDKFRFLNAEFISIVKYQSIDVLVGMLTFSIGPMIVLKSRVFFSFSFSFLDFRDKQSPEKSKY